MKIARVIIAILLIPQLTIAAQYGFSPTDNATGVNGWTNPNNGELSDDVYASEATDNDAQDYFTFGVALTNETITNVSIGYEACGTEGIDIQVSWNGGSVWSTAQTTAGLAACSTVPPPPDGLQRFTWFDFTSATSWDADALNDTNFRMRAVHNQAGGAGTNYYDYFQLSVTYIQNFTNDASPFNWTAGNPTVIDDLSTNVRYDWIAGMPAVVWQVAPVVEEVIVVGPPLVMIKRSTIIKRSTVIR